MRLAVLALALIVLTASGPGAQPSFPDAARAAAGLPRLHSLLISHRGTRVFERYYNNRQATDLANVKSVSKSIISALVGIAIQQRLIPSVHDPIGPYFPDVLRAKADAAKREITIEDLLTMRSGLESTSSRNYGKWVRSSNWVRYTLTRPLEDPPGTSMEYSTGNSHLLSAILTKAAKRSTWQYAQEVLAKPLGFTLARWMQDPQGIYFGGNEMMLLPRQMLAFGELYLNLGHLGGQQVVPSQWVKDSFVPRGKSDYGDQLYGYGWWMRELAGEQAYYAWGFGGQYIFVVPRLQLVVVTTSSTEIAEERGSHRRSVLGLVEELIIAPMAQ